MRHSNRVTAEDIVGSVRGETLASIVVYYMYTSRYTPKCKTLDNVLPQLHFEVLEQGYR
jgi:hypothetical protein